MTKTQWMWAGAAALLGASWLQSLATSDGTAIAAPSERVDITLHGGTPSMAWSPDSKRIAINAAYRYYGDEAQIERYRSELGVYVVDATTGAKVRVGTEQGYHPLWLDQNVVAWGNSLYEDGADGLWASPADRSAPRRIGSVDNVHHTVRSKDGGIAFFEMSHGWAVANPKTGAITRLPQAGRDSWVAPKDQTADQCLQQANGAQLAQMEVEGKKRWVVRVGDQTHPLTPKPFAFGVGDEWLPDGHKGLVRPCLSPDGQKVAFLVQEDGGGFRLRVGDVPH